MMHWSLSRSYEYCFGGRTAALPFCGVARNCPELSESAAVSDTFCEAVSKHSMFPGAAFSCEYNPTVFSDAHRKTPASAERHEDEYMSQADALDGRCDTSPAPAAGESPMGQTRRKRLLGRWTQPCLHTCGSVFFTLKLRVVAFFPRLGSSELDFPFVQNSTKCFNTYRGCNLFCHEVLSQFLQRPSFERAAQKVRRAFCSFCNKSFVIFGKLCRTARTRLWLQSCHSLFIKFLDDGSNMMLRVINQLRNGRDFIALFRGQYHLGTTDFDTISAASQYSLNPLTFIHFKFAYVETHNSPPCKYLIVSLHNIGIHTRKILKLKLTF